MTKIKLLKTNQYGKAGEIIEVTGNIGHGIIDRGEGILNTEGVNKIQSNKQFYSDKMMRSK